MKSTPSGVSGGEQRNGVGRLVKQIGHPLIVAVADQITRAVTSVMAHVEGFETLGGRSVVGRDSRIGEIDAACLVEVGGAGLPSRVV